MTTRRIRLQEVSRPRLVTQTELAYHLGMSPNTLTKRAEELRLAGMPQPDPLLELWDLDAIDSWLDARRALLGGKLDGRPATAQAPDPDLDARIRAFG